MRRGSMTTLARGMVAQSKGTVEFKRDYVHFYKQIGETTLHNFASDADAIAKDFMRDLRLACEQATSFAVKPNEVGLRTIYVMSFHNVPGIEVVAGAEAVPDDRRWTVLELLKKKGYRPK